MPKTNLKNFVTVRKTRGDILSPAAYHSTVAMIQGMLKQFDFADFSTAYRSFLNHLVDYNDPHQTIHTDFFPQIIARTYGIYALMTASPVDQPTFTNTIAKTPAFLELLRRIVLNRHVYNKVKNGNGSVNATVSVFLGPDWHPVLDPNTALTLTFGGPLATEADFIRSGWLQPTTPIGVVFTANNLTPMEPIWEEVFHTSPEIPYFAGLGVTANYIVGLNSSSNDLRVYTQLDGTSLADKIVYKLNNQTQTLVVTYTADGKVSLKLGAAAVGTNLPCNDRRFWLTFVNPGTVSVAVEHNGVVTTSSFTLPGAVSPFTQLQVVQANTNVFSPANLAIGELTVQRMAN